MKNIIAIFIVQLVFCFNVYATGDAINCSADNNQSEFDAANMNCFVNDTPADAERVNANFKVLLSLINPPGLVAPFAGTVTSIPDGWLSCDGSEVSRVTYANLFAAIGTAHGEGDGITTFNLPDYRGRFLRGVDAGAGRDPNAADRTVSNIGGNIGDAVGSVQEDEFKNHTHSKGPFRGDGVGFHVGATPSRWRIDSAGEDQTGESGGDETRPKNAYVNWMIKY